MGLTLACLIIATLAAMAFIRLAPTDPAKWHVSPALHAWDHGAPWDVVVPITGGATLRLSPERDAPADLLARLDAVATATPRTLRLAGTLVDGRITWESRSLIWGFPDYTTAEVRPDGLYILSRQRFGSNDFGVNATRLTDWLSRL